MAGALGELRRVLTDGARLGLLVFVADGALTYAAPEGNEFPSEAETRELLAAAGTLGETLPILPVTPQGEGSEGR